MLRVGQEQLAAYTKEWNEKSITLCNCSRKLQQFISDSTLYNHSCCLSTKNVAHQATPMVVCPNASSSMAVYGMLLHQRRLQLALMDCRSSADDDQLETSSRESFVHSFHPSRCCWATYTSSEIGWVACQYFLIWNILIPWSLFRLLNYQIAINQNLKPFWKV